MNRASRQQPEMKKPRRGESRQGFKSNVNKESNVMQKLSINTRKAMPLHRLPFVGRTHAKAALSFWLVPKTGGYFGGHQTGSALAHIYMKHLKEHGRGFGGTLQSVVLDMFGCEQNVSAEQNALRGQAVGFLSVLEPWIEAAVTNLGSGLDKLDVKQLLNEANAGLNFDHDAYMASLREAS